MGSLFKGSQFVGERLAEGSVFSVLARERRRPFCDGVFDDLSGSRGRRSVPPRAAASVTVPQRWFGLFDREAVAAFEFDLRWRYACGALDVDGGGSATRCWWAWGPPGGVGSAAAGLRRGPLGGSAGLAAGAWLRVGL